MNRIILFLWCLLLFVCAAPAEPHLFGALNSQAIAAQPSAVTANSAPAITDAYAREIVERAVEYTPEGRQFVTDTLNSLEESSLRDLRKLIADDLERAESLDPSTEQPGAPNEVVPRYAFAKRLALWVVHYIDNRLGNLEYDMLVTGQFLRIAEGTGPVVFYDFKSDAGDAYSVAVDDSTLWLYRTPDGVVQVGGGPLEHPSGTFRLFLLRPKVEKRAWYFACKVEPVDR